LTKWKIRERESSRKRLQDNIIPNFTNLWKTYYGCMEKTKEESTMKQKTSKTKLQTGLHVQIIGEKRNE
jgi:hypothetical protein